MRRSELVLWGAVLLPPLVPSIQAGVSVVEALSLIVPILAAMRLFFGPYSLGRSHPLLVLMSLYLTLSTLSLRHDSPNYFLPSFAAGLLYTLCAHLGSALPESSRTQVVPILFAHTFAGAVLDILLDYSGWGVGPKANMEFEIGARGQMTSTSLYGVYLAPFALWLSASSRSVATRVLAIAGLFASFYHVVVLGQGRGATLLILAGALVVMVLSNKGLVIAALVTVPTLTLAAVGTLDEATAPMLERMSSQSVVEVDRVNHVRLGMRLVESMDGIELLTGMWYREILAANGGVHLHNALFEEVTRYGIPAATVFALFFGGLAWNLIERLVQRDATEPANAVASAVTGQLLLAAGAAGLFHNWRMCVVSGICSGLVLASRK